MKFRLLLCILALIGLSAPAHAQIAAVTSPSGPVQAGPYVVIDANTGETLLDLRMRAGEGVGAARAGGLLLAGLALRRETARVDS